VDPKEGHDCMDFRRAHRMAERHCNPPATLRSSVGRGDQRLARLQRDGSDVSLQLRIGVVADSPTVFGIGRADSLHLIAQQATVVVVCPVCAGYGQARSRAPESENAGATENEASTRQRRTEQRKTAHRSRT